MIVGLYDRNVHPDIYTPRPIEEVLLAVLAMGFALAVSLHDWRTGKIPNRWLLWAMAGGLLLRAWAGARMSSVFPLLDGFQNALIALVVGFGLWKSDVWYPGDAKFFASLAFLMPGFSYEGWRLPIFPAFLLLLNTFILLIPFVLTFGGVQVLRERGSKAEERHRATPFLTRDRIAELGKGALGFVSMFMAIGPIRAWLSAEARQHSATLYLLLYVGLFLGFKFIQRQCARLPLWGHGLILLAALGVQSGMHGGIPALSGLAHVSLEGVLSFAVLMGARMLIGRFEEKIGTRRVKVKYLQRGMRISATAVREMEGRLGDLNLSGGDLTREDLDRLARAFRADDRVRIQSTTCFAPYLMLGLAATLATRTSLLRIVGAWYRNFAAP